MWTNNPVHVHDKNQSLSISIISGEGGCRAPRPPPSACPPPPHGELPGADEAAEAGRELMVDGVGAIERGARPESVCPAPENEGGFCCIVRSLLVKCAVAPVLQQGYSRERVTTQTTKAQYSHPPFRCLCLCREPLGIRKTACQEEVEVALGLSSRH
jgi:hypothetical protein